MPSRRWPELEYIKIPWELMETLLDKDAYDNEAQAAKALFNRCKYFFTGEESKLPKNLLREFRRFEKSEIDRYRNSVINGAKNRTSHSASPAETSDAGGTQTTTETKGSGTTLRVKNKKERDNKEEQDNVNVDFPSEKSTPFEPLGQLDYEDKCEAAFCYIERSESQGYDYLANAQFGFEDWVWRWHENGWVDANGASMDSIVTSRDGRRVPRWVVMLDGYASGVQRKAERGYEG